MGFTEKELAQQARYAETYAISQAPVMLAIERMVCGCDYGGNSWTTRGQADDLINRLDLGTSKRLLDLGAGSGWPSLYFARNTGCKAVLVDLPENGLRIAGKRAARDRHSEQASVVVADAAGLPFGKHSFDAISHSDLLCCLVRKRDVLEECRRVISRTGRMAFTVISTAPGLAGGELARAVANGPDFIETDQAYPSLLSLAGWDIIDQVDLTEAFAEACAHQIREHETHERKLSALFGPQQLAERLENWRRRLGAIRDGLIRRELLAASPDLS